MIDDARVKAYRRLYYNTRRWTCSVCNEDMKMDNKYKHLKKDYHLVGVENMIAKGLEVPNFIRKAPKNWKCPICGDETMIRNRSQHIKTQYHKAKVSNLVSKGLPVPNIFVNGKLGVSVDI